MMRRTVGVAQVLVIASLVVPHPGAAPLAPDNGAQVCATAYAGALSDIDQEDVLLEILRYQYDRLCRSSAKASSTTLDSGLKVIVEAVPVMASFMGSHNASSTSDFCSAAEKEENVFLKRNSYATRSVVAAQENFNQCVEIWNRGRVTITHRATPGQVVVSFARTDAETNFYVQGVTTRNFKCAVPGDDTWYRDGSLTATSEIKKNRNFTIICKQGGEERDGDIYYPFDAIVIGTNQGMAYVVEVSEETIYGPAKQSEAKATIATLEAKVKSLEDFLRKAEIQLDDLTVETHYFWTTSGPVGLTGAVGDKWNHYDVATKRYEQWIVTAKERYCPDAQHIFGERVRSQSGNCCGNNQYMVACVYFGGGERRLAQR